MKIVYYLGDKYYDKSGSMLGVLYTEEGQRYDWGKLQIAVERGEDVLVRKATPEMIAWAEIELSKFKANEDNWIEP